MKLIYSQDVINLIEKSPINGWVKDALIDDIKELPDLESCDGCKWEYAFGYGECYHCRRSFTDMYEESVE